MRTCRFSPICLLASLLATGACHTFQPATVDELVPGQTVRARISGQFSDSLSTILLRDARDVEGLVVTNEDSSLLLEINVDNEFQGMRLQQLSQRVDVPKSAFVDVEIKELDRTRTYGAIALVGAAVATIVIMQVNKGSGGGSIPGEGGPVDAIVAPPSVGIRLPWGWSR